jgi:hypothetical protein
MARKAGKTYSSRVNSARARIRDMAEDLDLDTENLAPIEGVRRLPPLRAPTGPVKVFALTRSPAVPFWEETHTQSLDEPARLVLQDVRLPPIVPLSGPDEFSGKRVTFRPAACLHDRVEFNTESPPIRLNRYSALLASAIGPPPAHTDRTPPLLRTVPSSPIVDSPRLPMAVFADEPDVTDEGPVREPATPPLPAVIRVSRMPSLVRALSGSSSSIRSIGNVHPAIRLGSVRRDEDCWEDGDVRLPSLLTLNAGSGTMSAPGWLSNRSNE